MQAYWNNPENKHFIMTLMLAEHEGFPPVLTPDAPPDSGALDYEERLGIPLPIALVGEWVWLGAPAAYARTWPKLCSQFHCNVWIPKRIGRFLPSRCRHVNSILP